MSGFQVLVLVVLDVVVLLLVLPARESITVSLLCMDRIHKLSLPCTKIVQTDQELEQPHLLLDLLLVSYHDDLHHETQLDIQ